MNKNKRQAKNRLVENSNKSYAGTLRKEMMGTNNDKNISNENTAIIITKVKAEIIENQKVTLDALISKMKTDILEYVVRSNSEITNVVNENTSKINAIVNHLKIKWKKDEPNNG